MKRLITQIVVFTLMLASGSTCAEEKGANTCYLDSEFPLSAVKMWTEGISNLPVTEGQKWQLSLKKIRDLCGIEPEFLKTAVVIRGANLPNAAVATMYRIDVPVEITIPGNQRRFFIGHQYTPEGLRKKGQPLFPSFIYGSTDYTNKSPNYYACRDSNSKLREEETIQFRDINAQGFASVRLSFIKALFVQSGGNAIKSCIVEYSGTAQLISN